MKKVVFLIIGIMLSISLNAQWYYNYNVTNVNDLTEIQCNLALRKANGQIETAKIMTLGGAIASIAGIIVYSNSLENETEDILDGDYDVNTGGFTAGAVLAYGGAAICGIGIPIWISGEMKKNQVEIALKKFDTAYNNTTSFGVGMRVTF